MDIIVTGASGFLGKVCCQHLRAHRVIRLSRSEGDIIADLAKEVPTLPASDLVVHAAGLAHIQPRSRAEKAAFFDVNVRGTEHLLAGLAASAVLPRYFVYISSVAVYGVEAGLDINEQAPLLARDAYGQSKAEAEARVAAWCREHGVVCSLLRLPLIYGAAPKGNLAAMWKALSKGYYFNVGGGNVRRSMVLAQDVAKALLTVAPLGGTYNLTDGRHPTLAQLSAAMARRAGCKPPANMPHSMALLLARMGDMLGSKAPINRKKLQKITSDLIFDDSLARERFQWQPEAVIDHL